MRSRVLALAILGVDVGRGLMCGSAPGPIVDGIAPEPSSFGPAAAGIQHRQRRLIGENLVGRQHRAEQQFIERLEPPARTSDPGAERGAVERDALALEHLRLAVERKRVTEFADHHMSNQRLGGHPAVDRPLRRRCLQHRVLAGAARITRAADHLHAQLAGDDVELLGAVLADQVQRAATTGAGFAVDIDHHLIARQMRGQCPAIAVGWLAALPSR